MNFTDKSFWTTVVAVVVANIIYQIGNNQLNKMRTDVPKATKENV